MIVKGACHHDCPDTCVWEVTVEGSQAVRLRGSRDHPTTRGELCPKVNKFLDRVYHADRLLTPLRRVGPKGAGEFEPIGWPDAIETIAAQLSALIDEHGGQSILPFSFDGTQGRIQKGVMADRFFAAISSSQIRRHLCGVTAWLGSAEVSGVPFGIDPEDLRHAQTILLWGTNTRLTNRHLWPSIEAARANGATVVVLDPVRTVTADHADHFIQLRPGTDVALVLAMIGVLDRDGLIDQEFLDHSTTGWPELRSAALALPLAEAAAITGVEARTIEWLATTYATKRPAAIRVLVGPEHREHGQDLFRSLTMLPAVVGAWKDRGGGLARSTQVYFEEAIAPDVAHPPGRVFNMAELGAVLTNGALDPPIRALVVHNSNPAVIVPDQNAVLAGLARSDLFTVVIEQFLTDTARYADVLLPATTQLEHLDLMVSWGHLYLALNRPAIPPVGEALPNTEIFRRLAGAMGLTDAGLQDDDETLVRQLLDTGHPYLAGVTLESLSETTWSRLAVPTRPYVDEPPRTMSGRLQLGAIAYRAGTETPTGDPDLAARFPLTLMSMKQHPRFLNANYGGFDDHLPRRGEPHLEIHPHDAGSRGMADGDRARVFNDRGELDLVVSVTDRVQPGVVGAPFGWWASRSPGGRTVNVLTNPQAPGGVGSAAFHETLVQVEPAGRRGDAPGSMRDGDH
jgi:anaerobic selenocysteine-containing dehydrogenase